MRPGFLLPEPTLWWLGSSRRRAPSAALRSTPAIRRFQASLCRIQHLCISAESFLKPRIIDFLELNPIINRDRGCRGGRLSKNHEYWLHANRAVGNVGAR